MAWHGCGIINLLECVQGTDLLKHGRLGKPKMHFFRLAEGDSVLTWRSANGKPRSIPLASVKQVTQPT